MSPPSPETRAFIELHGVSKAFQEGGQRHVVFRQAEAEIDSGEFVVLLGRSGSGKSTLLNLLSGLELADEGEVRVAGRSLSRLSERERTLFRRRHIGFVFQFFNLLPTLTVLENVRLRPELKGSGASASRDTALDLLERVGLADRAETFPDRLSGGEQQRVAIAGALAHDPELILADEPTGNLDLETGRQVVALLDDLVRTAGKTLVMATHSPDMVGIADRLVTVEDGGLTVRSGERRT